MCLATMKNRVPTKMHLPSIPTEMAVDTIRKRLPMKRHHRQLKISPELCLLPPDDQSDGCTAR